MPLPFDVLTTVSAITISLGVSIFFYMKWSQARQDLRGKEESEQIDDLTQLYNRKAFYALLEEAFVGTGSAYVGYIDISNLKEVNECLGNQVGDSTLVYVAKALRQTLPETSIIARIDGDSFGVILNNIDEEHALDLFHSLSKECCESCEIEGHILSVDLNIGIANCREDCASSEEVLRRAERAMGHAKSKAEGPMCYSSVMDEPQRVRREIRSELGLAFRNGELKLAFQPIASAKTGQLASAEALLRWPTKMGPASSPAEFIPIAEETGLIIDIGDWVIEQALENIKRFENLPIAVNVSPRQFLNTSFATRVADRVIAAGVDPKLLKIEITESVLITHTDVAERILRELREMGVQILLDDFGTGYSSLSYIQRFPFDILKIDRAFVRTLNKSSGGTDLLSAIVNLGHSLNMGVVAEGVETKSQALMLQGLGCDFLQGYALGAPGPIEKLESFDYSHVLAPQQEVQKVAIGQ